MSPVKLLMWTSVSIPTPWSNDRAGPTTPPPGRFLLSRRFPPVIGDLLLFVGLEGGREGGDGDLKEHDSVTKEQVHDLVTEEIRGRGGG